MYPSIIFRFFPFSPALILLRSFAFLVGHQINARNRNFQDEIIPTVFSILLLALVILEDFRLFFW